MYTKKTCSQRKHVHKENMSTIEIEDGREAPKKPSIIKIRNICLKYININYFIRDKLSWKIVNSVWRASVYIIIQPNTTLVLSEGINHPLVSTSDLFSTNFIVIVLN